MASAQLDCQDQNMQHHRYPMSGIFYVSCVCSVRRQTLTEINGSAISTVGVSQPINLRKMPRLTKANRPWQLYNIKMTLIAPGSFPYSLSYLCTSHRSLSHDLASSLLADTINIHTSPRPRHRRNILPAILRVFWTQNTLRNINARILRVFSSCCRYTEFGGGVHGSWDFCQLYHQPSWLEA